MYWESPWPPSSMVILWKGLHKLKKAVECIRYGWWQHKKTDENQWRERHGGKIQEKPSARFHVSTASGNVLNFPRKKVYDNTCELLSVRETNPCLSGQGFYWGSFRHIDMCFPGVWSQLVRLQSHLVLEEKQAFTGNHIYMIKLVCMAQHLRRTKTISFSGRIFHWFRGYLPESGHWVRPTDRPFFGMARVWVIQA